MADIRRVSHPFSTADAGTAATLCIPVTEHIRGQIVRVTTCLGGAISGADSKVVVSKNATVLGTITIAYTSSAAGDIDYLDIAGVELSVGDFITIANGGESTGVAILSGTIDIVR